MLRRLALWPMFISRIILGKKSRRDILQNILNHFFKVVLIFISTWGKKKKFWLWQLSLSVVYIPLSPSSSSLPPPSRRISVTTCTDASVIQQQVAMFLVFSLFGFSFFPCFLPLLNPNPSPLPSSVLPSLLCFGCSVGGTVNGYWSDSPW